RDPFSPAVQLDTGEGEVLRNDVVDPGVLHLAHLDEGPGVVLVGAAGEVGEAPKVFHADVLQPPGPGVLADGAAAVLLVQGVRQRGVEGDRGAFDPRDAPGPVQVLGVGLPGVLEQVHADVVDPVGRAGPVHDHGVPDVEPRDAVQPEADGPHRHVLVNDVAGRPDG